MKYFKDNNTGEVFGFEETDNTQLPYMQAKIDAGLEEITGSWPLPESEPEPQPVAEPTKAELLQQLQTLADKINAIQ